MEYNVLLSKKLTNITGGGQPFDSGFIHAGGCDSKKFEILDARMDRETECIRHIGKFTGEPFNKDDQVKIEIDKEKRFLHCQLHTAGHLVDAALQLMGYKWPPTKG